MILYEVERQLTLSRSIFSGLVTPNVENSDGDVAFSGLTESSFHMVRDNNSLMLNVQ